MEEQFYLIVPILLWVAVTRFSLKVYAVLIASLAMISFVFWFQAGFRNPDAAFYLIFARFWELAAGVLVAVTRSGALGKNIGFTCFVSGGATGAIAAWFVLAICLLPVDVPKSIAYPSVVFATALILVGDISSRPIGKVLVAPLVNLLGRASYSIYLWHWPLLVLSSWSIGRAPLLTVGLLLASIIIGVFSMRFVENPIRFGVGNGGAALGVGFGCMLVSAAVPLMIGFAKLDLYLGKRPEMLAFGTPSLFEAYSSRDGSVWTGSPCILSSNEQVGKDIEAAGCTFGDPDTADSRVLVLGNSYSASFVPAFAEVAIQKNLLVTLTSSWGASPAPGLENTTPWSAANRYYWQRVMPDLLNGLVAGDVVVLASDLTRYVSIDGADLTESIMALESSLRNLSAELSERGLSLAVLGPLPFARAANCDPVMATPQWFAPNGAPCLYFGRQETIEAQFPLREMLSRISVELSVRLISLDDVFCPGVECTYLGDDNLILYRDQFSHPSVEASIVSAPIFSAAIRDLQDEFP